MATITSTEVAGTDAKLITDQTKSRAELLPQMGGSVSPWVVVTLQFAVGALITLVAWVWAGKQESAMSAACGSLAVAIPAAIFARGITSKFAVANAGSAVASFFVWELVKVLLTVAILLSAHRYVDGLSWPIMLIGLVVTMKVYWLALGFKGKGHPLQREAI
jgi:ATP synthase protein I